MGNPDVYPGFISVYDVHADCRHPVLDADGPFARLGHESGFSVDGRTFYATSVNANAITAIDVTDPKAPQSIWLGDTNSHGMTLSDDGNRAYIADTRGQLLILDTSEIQARKPDPQAHEISRLTWASASIPQTRSRSPSTATPICSSSTSTTRRRSTRPAAIPTDRPPRQRPRPRHR